MRRSSVFFIAITMLLASSVPAVAAPWHTKAKIDIVASNFTIQGTVLDRDSGPMSGSIRYEAADGKLILNRPICMAVTPASGGASNVKVIGRMVVDWALNPEHYQQYYAEFVWQPDKTGDEVSFRGYRLEEDPALDCSDEWYSSGALVSGGVNLTFK